MDVKCQVKVSHLTLGNREGHEEVKTYKTGDILIIPEKLAKELGTSVIILGSFEKEVEKEPKDEIRGGRSAKTRKH